MRKRTVITEDVEGVECEMSFEPIEWIDMHKAKTDEHIVVGYCVQDDYRDIDDMIGDCMGKLYSFHRHASRDDHQEGLRALGNDRDGSADLDKVWEMHSGEAVRRYIEAVLKREELEFLLENFEQRDSDYERRDGETPEDTARRYLQCDIDDSTYNGWAYVEYESVMQDVLTEMWDEPAYFPGDPYARVLACYDHSGQHWSLSGRGMQCRWDTSNQAGVWVPDDCLRKEIESLPEAERDAAATKFCEQFLGVYNDVINGNVFGIVVEWFDSDGKLYGNNHCWGHIGSKWAEEALKELFDYHQMKLAETHNKALSAKADIPWTEQEEEAFRSMPMLEIIREANWYVVWYWDDGHYVNTKFYDFSDALYFARTHT